MAKRPPLHPIEKWAHDAAKTASTKYPTTKSQVVMTTTLLPIANSRIARKTRMTTLRDTLCAMAFATDVIRGRGQIVRLSDDIYADVARSRPPTANNEASMPWPSFAIEIRDNDTCQAVIAMATSHIRLHEEEIARTLGIDLEDLRQVIETAKLDEMPMGLSLIPTRRRQEDMATEFRRQWKSAMPVATRLMNEDSSQMTGMFDRLDTMPYGVTHTRPKGLPSADELTNLLEFVCSDNADMHCVRKPSQSARTTARKRKVSNAHIWEAGVTWSDAYATYREAKRTASRGGHLRPHWRRGHFHRFRIGPRDEEARYVTHWIPPTLIAAKPDVPTTNQGHRYR